MRRPSRNCLTIICAQAPSRPEGRAQRGRSEAQRLARCRAQMQHRCRDGQRRRRDARCDHLTTAASPRRMHERESPFFTTELAGKHAPNGRDCGQHFPDEQDRIVRKIWVATKHVRCGKTRRFSPPNMLCSTTCSDRHSHGVSDPSGHARGHVGRAQRGRSRHGFLL